MDLGNHPAGEDFPAPLLDWVKGQRLALGTALLRTDPDAWSDTQEAVFRPAWPKRKIEGSTLALVETMRQLPPAALEGLATLTAKQCDLWSDYTPLWGEALRTAKWHESSRRSPIAGAKLIANRLTHGALKPAQFPRLAKLEMRADWEETPEVRTGLRRIMQDLQGARLAGQRIDALTRFPSRTRLSRWRMVENAILQQSFAWPLLVLTPASGESTYCTLPVIVDVRLNADPLPPREEVALRQFEPADGETHIIEASAWEVPIRKALLAAKDLWAYKHPGCDPRFLRMIENASVTIDLRVAEAVVAPYRNWGQFAFDGDSLEVYLALVILGGFLNSRAMETICATGTLARVKRNGYGKDRQDRGSDRFIGRVGGVDLKTRCVADSFFFDQLIVPSGQTPENPSRRLKISEGRLLSHYADHVFGDEWRRHRWVRCPDLAAGFKDKDLSEEEESEISLILRILELENQKVVTLDESISAMGVARALKRLNDLTAKLPELERGSRIWERQGSYTVIRTVDREINERFWQVVWEALGADPAKFEPFCHLVSRDRPGQLLADELNRFLPDAVQSRRAPDILVIVGSDRLMADTSMPTGPFARLQIDTITRAAAATLRPSPIDSLRKFIKQTRIILVPRDWADTDEMPIGAVPPELQRAMRRLSIFRHGFTFHIARRMLGLDEASCLQTLQALQSPRANGTPWLSYGVSNPREFPPDAAYEYYLTEKAALPTDREELATLHFDAANAIVGFLEPSPDAARFDFEQALSPVWLHEAQHHLSAAWQNRRDTNASPQERERLSRVGEPFGWSAVRWAATFSHERDTDMLGAVKEHLAQKRKRNETVHPVELVWAAKLSFKLQRDGKGDEDFRRKMLAYAWSACDSRPTKAEQEACRFVVATTRAAQKMQLSGNEIGLARAREDNDEALGRLSKAQDVLDPEWFEYMGDAEPDHRRAAALYRQGFWNQALKGAEHSGGGGGLTKYLGACNLARIEPDPAVLARLQEPQPSGMRKYIHRHDAAPPSGLVGFTDQRLRFVHERWRIGRNQFLEIHRAPPKARPSAARRTPRPAA